MRLESVRISGFRSIDQTTLDSCGGFNVIIGKNNAGKSNILLAVSSFFSCLRDGVPISIDPPIGQSIDHFENRDRPIEISIDFRLSDEERDELAAEIVSEAPQVRNSAEHLGSDLRLQVSLVIPPAVEPFAFIREMVVVPQGGTGAGARLLGISEGAAGELASKARRARTREQEGRYIARSTSRVGERFDSDDWDRLKSTTSRDRSALRYLIPGHENSPSKEASKLLEDLVLSADSQSAFLDAAKNLAASIAAQASDLRSEPLQHRIDSFSGQEESVPQYATSLLQRVARVKVLYLTERRDPIGRKEAAQLLDLKVRRGGPEKLRSIQQTVSALLGVDIDAFRADAAQQGSEPGAEMDVDRFLVQVNGAGIREALRLILDFEFGRPDILLVEEPEIHLHPALETSMMRYLKGAGGESQIFITTHSTNFLDTAEMRNVYLASRDDSTKVQLLNVAEAEESIPRELGIRLSSLFMFDRLVFVEGPSDEDVIREWASLLGINLGQSNVGFVSMDGVRNFAHYATEKTISFLSRRRVKMYFVLDRDERDDAEVQQLTKRLGEQAELCVLERREIENYLLAPRALANFIRVKRELGGVANPEAPEITEVNTALSTAADSLKDLALDKRVSRIACRPIYPDRNRVLQRDSTKDIGARISEELERQRTALDSIESSLAEIRAREEQALNEQWGTKKTQIVPGDFLLDEVCRGFGVRFVKERDSARLAALMTAEEIPTEIRGLLNKLIQR